MSYVAWSQNPSSFLPTAIRTMQNSSLYVTLPGACLEYLKTHWSQIMFQKTIVRHSSNGKDWGREGPRKCQFRETWKVSIGVGHGKFMASFHLQSSLLTPPRSFSTSRKQKDNLQLIMNAFFFKNQIQTQTITTTERVNRRNGLVLPGAPGATWSTRTPEMGAVGCGCNEWFQWDSNVWVSLFLVDIKWKPQEIGGVRGKRD